MCKKIKIPFSVQAPRSLITFGCDISFSNVNSVIKSCISSCPPFSENQCKLV